MSDITKCSSKECSLRHNCYRSLAADNEYYQSYSDFYIGSRYGCEHYWPLKEEKQMISKNTTISKIKKCKEQLDKIIPDEFHLSDRIKVKITSSGGLYLRRSLFDEGIFLSEDEVLKLIKYIQKNYLEEEEK